MALTFDPLIEEGTGDARAAMAQGFTDLAAFLATHPAVPLPGGTTLTISVRVPGGPRGKRIEALEEIAERMGVPVTGEPCGLLEARREFGPVALVAHVAPEGSRHLTERLDALGSRTDAEALRAYEAALDEVDQQLAEEADVAARLAAEIEAADAGAAA